MIRAVLTLSRPLAGGVGGAAPRLPRGYPADIEDYLGGLSNCFHSCAQCRKRCRFNSRCARTVGKTMAPAASAQTPHPAVTATTVLSRVLGRGPVRLPSASTLMVTV